MKFFLVFAALIQLAIGIDLSASLANYWPMNSLNDVVGNAHMFPFDANWSFYPDRFGVPASAIRITQGGLQVPAGNYFQGDFTISVWANFLSITTLYDRILDFSNGPNSDNIIFSLYSNTKEIGAHILNGNVYNGGVVSPTATTTNVWNHLVMVYSNQTKTASVYTNGVLSVSGVVNQANAVLRRINYIGKSVFPNPNESLVDCVYDDLKIYKRALTSDEIKADYTDSLVQPAASNTVNPVNFWSFSGDYRDEIGGAHLFGGQNYRLVNDRFGNPESAVLFDQGYLQAPEGFYFRGDFTISLWANFKALAVNDRILDFANGPGADNIIFCLDPTGGNKIHTRIVNGNVFTSGVTGVDVISANTWNHIMFVYDSATLTGFIYINGALSSSNKVDKANAVLRKINYIGLNNLAGNPAAYAIYDDIKIFNVALKPIQVGKEYQSSGIPAPLPSGEAFQNNLVNHWTFDNDLRDNVGGAHLFGGANYALVADRYNQANSAINFNLGFLQAPPGTYFYSEYTITAWIKLSSYGLYQRILDFCNAAPPTDNVVFYTGNASINAQTFAGTQHANLPFQSSVGSLGLNTWAHVAFVQSSSSAVLYINGNQVASVVSSIKNPKTWRVNNFIGKSSV